MPVCLSLKEKLEIFWCTSTFTDNIAFMVHSHQAVQKIIPHFSKSACPVGRGSRIYWLHLCREVRPPLHTHTMSVLDMTLNTLMMKSQLDNKLPQNVQNITWSHKLYRENHENLESGADSSRKKLGWNKDPKRYFPRRCTITLTIHNGGVLVV